MAPVEPPRLHFLSDAANLLALGSSSTAAHLLTVHTHILHDESKRLNPRQQKHHCAGCGNLRTCKASKTTKVKATKKSRALNGGSATILKCIRCHQRAVIPRKRSALRSYSKASSRVNTTTVTATAATALASPAKSTSEDSTQQDLPTPASTASTTPLEKTADNASSKKRAKSRKQGGLQALLAAKKSSQPSLDLLDFLQ